jgi:cytochrome c biogenesis protein CcdA
MKPFDYFKKTFVFVFIFYIVYKAVGLMFNKFADLNLQNVLKIILVAFTTALVLGVINYFVKVDFFTKKDDRKPKDN